MKKRNNPVLAAVLALCLLLAFPLAAMSVSPGEGRGGSPGTVHGSGDHGGAKMDMMMNGYELMKKGADTMLTRDRQKMDDGHRMVLDGHKMMRDAQQRDQSSMKMMEGADMAAKGADMMTRADEKSLKEGEKMMRDGLDKMAQAEKMMKSKHQ